jgi:hypothetical protein
MYRNFSEKECGGYFVQNDQCSLVPAGLINTTKEHSTITFYTKTNEA